MQNEDLQKDIKELAALQFVRRVVWESIPEIAIDYEVKEQLEEIRILNKIIKSKRRDLFGG